MLGCALVLAQGAQAARANVDALILATHHDALGLDIGDPSARGVVLGMAYIVAVARLFATDLTGDRHQVFSSRCPLLKGPFLV